jgi:hypothetical protein
VAIGPVRGFAYGLPQELGTIDHAAQPFMRPAFESASGQSFTIIRDATWRELAGRGIQRPTSSVDAFPEGEV